MGSHEIDELRALFGKTRDFDASPLYKQLSSVAAAHTPILRLATHARAGQQPTFLLFAAVHQLLLDGVSHPLRGFYPSVVADHARATEDAAEPFIDFCATHATEISEIVAQRLVQTNSVRRSLALALGLSVIASLTDEPVHLIEVGASAGLNLLFDRYAYRLGDHAFGSLSSSVQIRAELRDSGAPFIPPAALQIATRQGVDLNPLDLSDQPARRWLRALVWPDQHDRRQLLDAAIDLANGNLPPIRQLDVAALDGPLDLGLPDGAPRVLYHFATRMHVLARLRPMFDRGVDLLGTGGPAFVITMEPGTNGAGCLQVRDPIGQVHRVASLDGHLTWVRPLRRT